MSFVKCNACVSPWDCGAASFCLNCHVTQKPNLIYDELAKYDALVASNKANRAADPKFEQPKLVIATKPTCWHTRSEFGICTKCGDWFK